MSKKEIFALGALGGILPVLASLITADLSSLIDHSDKLTIGNYVGYGIRTIALIIIGGIVALLNTEVKQPLALVQLGMAAPALVTSYINGSVPPLSNVPHASLSFVTLAHAEPSHGQKNIILAGLLNDVFQGIVLPPAATDSVRPNLQPQFGEVAEYPATPAGLAPAASSGGQGNVCATIKGRFGPGLFNPVGKACAVRLEGTILVGRVSQ